MRKITIILLILTALAVPSIVFAEQLTSWEQGIYNAIMEKLFNDGASKSPNQAITEIAVQYNITEDAVRSIRNKGLDREPTATEQQIYNEIWQRYFTLGGNATWADRQRVMNEVGARYGITGVQVLEIDDRYMDWVSKHKR